MHYFQQQRRLECGPYFDDAGHRHRYWLSYHRWDKLPGSRKHDDPANPDQLHAWLHGSDQLIHFSLTPPGLRFDGAPFFMTLAQALRFSARLRTALAD